MSFKIGQKVVYIGNTSLQHGEIYTVTDSVICHCGAQAISVNNILNPEGKINFKCHRCTKKRIWTRIVTATNKRFFQAEYFRLLDHQFGKDIAAEIEELINEEFLIKSF
jgi:hypothetical protein